MDLIILKKFKCRLQGIVTLINNCVIYLFVTWAYNYGVINWEITIYIVLWR